VKQTRRAGIESREVPLSKARIVLLINFVPPYRLALFEDLADRVGELLVWVSTPMEANRAWQPEWGRLNVEVQRCLTLEQSKRHPHGFTERQIVHIPYDTIPRLRRTRPDLVFTAEFGLRTAQAAVWCAVSGTPLAVFAGFSEWSEKGRDRDRVRRVLRRALLARADVMFVPGQSGARYVRRLGARPERVVIAPFHSPVTAPAPVARPGGDTEGGRRLLVVGQLIERKGVLSLVDALARWGRRHPGERASLRLVGEGPLADRLAAVPLPGNVVVELVGSLPYERMAEAYHAADVLVFPTLADVWGLVVNEAMGAGLPVLGSVYAQAVEELVQDGVSGWHFAPDRPEEFDQALERVLATDPVELARMGAQARQAVAYLTPEYIADVLVDGLRLTLDQR
jgi:glycosyltransferase involved in cell wall biosynthesis